MIQRHIGTRYSEGDVVATPDGLGVVAAVLTDDFEFPQGSDDETAVEASDEQPAYVVGLKDPGSAVYRASALESSSLDNGGSTDVDDGRLAFVQQDVDGLDTLPEGWDRESVLEYWEEIGGEWTDCVGELTDEFEEDRAKQLCSAMKDELLQTKRWRNRF